MKILRANGGFDPE